MNKTMLLGIVLATGLRAQQATIIDTGSTNIPGMTVSVGAKGRVLIEYKNGQKAQMSMSSELNSRLLRDLEAAHPVDQLKTRHCMKSASFGSRLFVEYKGVRSPDLSCPGQTDPKADALRTDLQEIMAEARKK